MSNILHRTIAAEMPVAIGGDGPYIIDSTGKRYLDASGGAAVSCLGHGHERVNAAIRKQLDIIAFAHTGFFTTEAAEQLATLLTRDAPGDLNRAVFCSGGSEATEAALKLVRQYHMEIGQPQRTLIVSRRQSYHGASMGALTISGSPGRRDMYAPFLFDAKQIAPCYSYRDRRDDESEEAYGLRVANELEAAILEAGTDRVAAFFAEPVSGASLGCVTAVPGYFKRIREICDRYGVLLVFDEVMCGIGRTGTLHACEQEGVAPDLMLVAKGLGAGYQPIGAVLVSDRVTDAIAAGSGTVQHGQTYLGHPVTCAAALAVLQTIHDDRLLENVQRQGAALQAAMQDRFGNHHHVGDIRGRGLFHCLELVQDRATKRPFDPKHKLHARIKRAGLANGLICYPMGGTVEGREGDHVLLAPPYTVGPREIEEMVHKLGLAVDAALAELPG